MDLILEATRRLLVERGLAATTTNAIARTAGVSVGSIYQYFGSKEAIVRQLAVKQWELVLARAREAANTDLSDLNGTVRRFVEILASVETGDPRLRRVLLLEVPRGWIRQTTTPVHQAVRLLVADTIGRLRREAPDERAQREAFVLTHAVQGVIDAALLERDEPLETALIDELGALIIAYLQKVIDREASAAGSMRR